MDIVSHFFNVLKRYKISYITSEKCIKSLYQMNVFMSKKTNGILWFIGYAVVSDDHITLKKHDLSDNKVQKDS